MTRLDIWLGLPMVLLGLALGWLAIDQRASWHALFALSPPVVIEFAGTRHRLPTDQLTELAEFSSEHFAAADSASQQRIRTALDAELDALFLDLDARLPGFADWYYSMTAEYSRLFFGIIDQLRLSDSDYLAGQVQQRIFDDARFVQRLEALQLNVFTQLDTESRTATESWAIALISRLDTYPKAYPIPGFENADLTIDLDATLQRLIGLDDPRFDQRILFSAVALCAPSGPIALSCGVAIGVASWIAIDYGLLSLDEKLNRQQLIDDWRASLNSTREGLRQELHQRLDTAIGHRFDVIQGEVQRSFVPAEHLHSGPDGQG
ncbi:hypothetical protein [Halotalea alkalilenta]|uniref:Uncharacterized protein n=1 Tax=Halotalea alkalilenta TaxID=376489 RepID=A0A172YAV0_9GAMM|nr:hypothetical protein [Halotalea alkalilenta]ANF56256.1 hypothetical protein A5892_01240 [Halotalea alkalilenta]